MSADTATPHAAKPSARVKSDGAEGFNEGVATLKDTRDSLNHVAGECMAMCTDTMAAAMESTTRNGQMMSELAKSYMDACSATTVVLSEIGREAVGCRTPADFVALQKRAVDGLNSTLTASTQLYGDIFAAWSKSFEPLVARVADGPERLFRALAD